MTFKYRYRKQIISLVAILFFIGVLGVIFICNRKYQNTSTVSKKEVLLSKTSTNKNIQNTDNEKIEYKVDIKGQVINPGIYTLEEGSRVSDVIQLAGGLTEIGDTTVINLSKKIQDEMVIIIYSREEVENFKETKMILEQVIDNCKNNNDLKNDACISTDDTESTQNETVLEGTISINSASKEQLQTLPGIGEAKAESIIKYREEHGGFQSLEEIMEISGIGEVLFAKIKENITL